MNPRLKMIVAAASTAWCASAIAVPSPPQGCTGQPGVGGCAPYLNVYLSDGSGPINLYEYDLPTIDIGQSRPLTDAHATGSLLGGRLTVSARAAEDTDVNNVQSVDVGSTLVDLFTLNSSLLAPGTPVNIVATVSAQGVGSIDVASRSVQSYLHVGFGSGIVAYGGGVLDAGSVLQAQNQVPTFQQFVVPLQVYANLTVQVGVPFELNASLRSIVVESSFLNFDSFSGLANGAQLSFALPAGSNVTSMGGFDSAAPVPEAGTAPMALAGLALLGLARRRWRRGAAAGALALAAVGPAHAGLVGDTVTAELLDLAGAGGVTVQFAPSAVVGAGTEFTATWLYTPLNQVWRVSLDLDDTGFTVSFDDIGGGNDHDLSGFTFLGLRLGSLDAGGAITSVAATASNGAAVQSIGWSATGITVQWNGFQFRDAQGAPVTGGSSAFAFTTAASVPEPGSGVLLLAGLAAMGAVARRRLRRGKE